MQFVLIGAIVLSGPVWPLNCPGAGLVGLGLAMLVWTLRHNRPGNFNILSVVRSGATLVESGPYRFVRHPMYTSTLLVMAGVVANAPDWPRVLLWFGCVGALRLKSAHEEKMLCRRFPAYGSYRKGKKRLIPFLY
jgi:protein-S-isoprenylcysteine O-methyltransferase Ste14